jgi:hypothetical protein
MTTPPQPRPALRRAADADVHPVTGRTSLKPRKGGATTSDAILTETKDKRVDLAVTIPKSLRKRLKKQSKERGVSMDDLVSGILAAALPREN